MIRLLCLLLPLCCSTACSLFQAQTPSQADWRNVEQGHYHPGMKCVAPGSYAVLDGIGAAAYAAWGLVGLSNANDGVFGDLFKQQAIFALVIAAGLAGSSYYGAQANAECERFDAALQARFGPMFYQGVQAPPSTGPLAPPSTGPLAPPSALPPAPPSAMPPTASR
jgi:hypothetical protein